MTHFFDFLATILIIIINNKYQGVKKIIFTACHSDKLKLTFTSPDISSTSPKSLLKSRIDLIVLELFEVVIPRKRSLAHWASSKQNSLAR